MSGHSPEHIFDDARGTAERMARLARDDERFKVALDASRDADGERFRGVLDDVGILDACSLVCGWFCSKTCVVRCLRLAGLPNVQDQPDLGEFADVVTRLGRDPDVLARLVEVVEADDADSYRHLLDEFDVGRFAHLLCRWVCSVRCRLVCRVLCDDRDDLRQREVVEELTLAARAVGKLAAHPQLLERATEAVLANDCGLLQKVLAEAGLARHCHQICWWLCGWRCMRVCLALGRRFLDADLDLSDDEIREFGQVTAKLAGRPEVLEKLVAAVVDVDERAFVRLVRELDLGRFALQLCHWLCWLHCRRYCICVCPPLVARIDDPAEGVCASAGLVTACTGTSGPLAGIEIVGTAAGGGFDHYTLRYRWGANPLVDTAVVYPDCSRPPAATSYGSPVVGGTLGWLDVSMLPPGITEFSVQLDVHDSASGTATDSVSFEVSTQAIAITHVATVEAVTAVDPFHPGSTIRLVKATADPNPLVPELSIGGAITVDGSAYTVGCSRIMSQFTLARFDAPPAAPVPTPPDASGGVNVLASHPVPYEDVPDHPWQSGCFPVITPNTILNGNLVAQWGQVNCTFLGTTYKVPKVKGTTWNTSGLNERAVVLLEVRDRPLAGPHPGTVAGTAQVAVWLDNHDPTALIESIGGIAGCGDVLLSNYVDSTAEIHGVAWDPPIDPTAPQQRPNDNFGSYALSFRKNGESTTTGIPAATPNTRVPNTWPALAPGASGLLAAWDIVDAIDHDAPGPTPAGKLDRGERCAYDISLSVVDTTHVGDSGSHHHATFSYAITIINDL